MQEYIRVRKDILEYNDQINKINTQTIKDLLKQRQDFKEWLEEEIKHPNNFYQMFDLLHPRESLDELVNMKLKEVLERLGVE